MEQGLIKREEILGKDFLEDYKNQLNKLPIDESTKKKFVNKAWESHLWKSIADKPTPFDIVEERDGGKSGNLEYFPEEYTINELNRLFPGWWCEEMQTNCDTIMRTVYTTGYLMIRYIDLLGISVIRKIYAVGASEIFSKVTDKFAPSQPDDRYKASRTEWIKLAGKWLGIGLDIYHQQITSELRSVFEDTIRDWNIYAQHWKNIASKCLNGHAFRTMLKVMPSLNQVKRFQEALIHFPDKDYPQLWQEFAKHNNSKKLKPDINGKNTSDYSKFEVFLIKIEDIANELKNKKGE